MIHELKIDPKWFYELRDNSKKFEIRFDDRGYRVGDILHLRETEYTAEQMLQGQRLLYTGREILACVVNITRDIVGLWDEWCIMSLGDVHDITTHVGRPQVAEAEVPVNPTVDNLTNYIHNRGEVPTELITNTTLRGASRAINEFRLEPLPPSSYAERAGDIYRVNVAIADEAEQNARVEGYGTTGTDNV